MEKTSVIIPVYNRAHLLKNTLFSLNSQSHLVEEAVITDDGSQQDIAGTIKEIVHDLRFQVKYVRQEDKGYRVAKCRNNGARIAAWSHLIFIDQDIVLTKHCIKTLVEARQKGIFHTSYPIRLTETQSEMVTDDMIKNGDFTALITQKQIRKVRRQFSKDRTYYILKRYLHLREIGPKLRSCVFSIHEDDFRCVNGFDENFQGWGNEDDDLGRRLHKHAILGRNPFLNEFPLHLHHSPFHQDGYRTNREYYEKRIREIRAGQYRSQYGIENPLGEEDVAVTVF
ncbi:MAG: glycosyltransferase [Candidatus Latescibacterota bacterium]